MRSGLALLAVIALAGCERLFDVAGAATDDGHSDALVQPDGPPGCITIGMNGTGQGTLGVDGFYKRCLLDTTRIVSIGGSFSTSGPDCDSDTIDSSVCAVVAHEIDVQGTVTVTGPLPLVLVATGVINVSGSLDLSSHPNDPGAGADWTGCNTLALAGGADGEGGAGGTLDPSFPGGYGGASQSPGPAPQLPTAPFAALHGGCEGGTGGPGVLSPTDSGGAVYLMAPVITVTGGIEANGGDGVGGAAGNGGGYGGGSGGMIALDAPTIVLGGGTLHARGGGGGGGGAFNGGGTMGDGGQGGSPGGNAGGFGGNGYMMPSQAFSGGTGSMAQEGIAGGGGGGGGGAGAILLFTTNPVAGGSFDPAAIQ